VSFQDCKDRCFRRLKHLGIELECDQQQQPITEEEEFCYIPMGGPLPAKDQRTLALGGAAAMVHPSTGYHLCRCMMGAADMATTIRRELTSTQVPLDLDRVASAAYASLWTPERIRQRNFAVFGGEFLMKQDVTGLRGFFDGFFKLPLERWGGFLAGWPGLPNNDKHESWYARMWFGLTFILLLPPQVAADMAWNIALFSVQEGVPLPQSVTPFLGFPTGFDDETNKKNVMRGDVAAKNEARRMIQASQVTQDLPVAFNDDEGRAAAKEEVARNSKQQEKTMIETEGEAIKAAN